MAKKHHFNKRCAFGEGGKEAVYLMGHRFGFYEFEEFNYAVAHLPSSCKVVILDLNETKVMDSAGVGCLSTIYNALQLEKRHLKIVGIRENLFEMFKEVGLDNFLDIEIMG